MRTDWRFFDQTIGELIMKFLVIGLGSMGKRRIRCFQALGHFDVVGFDLREDRVKEIIDKYSIRAFLDVDNAFEQSNPDAVIISVPPDSHHIYMKMAILQKTPFFVEASVVDTDMYQMKKDVLSAGLLAAPSATMLFHPGIKLIGEIVKSGSIGKISNIIYHTGQYLPDWHPYESVSSFYVSNPLTGGAREITPFELTWFTNVFGFPKRVCGNVRKTITILGAEKIDDTYNFLFDYGSYLATFTTDVVSRHGTRRLEIITDSHQLVWSWDKNEIQVFDGHKGKWDCIPYKMAKAETGYNANIGENMYIEEIRSFIDFVKKNNTFVNTLENDHKVLRLLYAIEQSDKESRFINVEDL